MESQRETTNAFDAVARGELGSTHSGDSASHQSVQPSPSEESTLNPVTPEPQPTTSQNVANGSTNTLPPPSGTLGNTASTNVSGQAHATPAQPSSNAFTRFLRRFALVVFIGLSMISWWYMEDTKAVNMLNAVLGGFIMLWAFVYWYDFRRVHGGLRGNAFLFLLAVFLMGFVNLMMALITYFHNRASEFSVARITVSVMLVFTFFATLVLWRRMSAKPPQ